MVKCQYRGCMRARQGDDEGLFLVDWQFVPHDFPDLDFPSSFMSSRWDPDRIDFGQIGEIRQVFYPQAQTRRMGWMRGQHYCGTLDQWLNGYPVGTPMPPWSGGAPVCCAPDEAAFTIGFDFGFES